MGVERFPESAGEFAVVPARRRCGAMRMFPEPVADEREFALHSEILALHHPGGGSLRRCVHDFPKIAVVLRSDL